MKNKKQQIKFHKNELKKSQKQFRETKRDTVQVRISRKYHEGMKKHKKEYGKTMSHWVDDACKWYLNNHGL
jgi:hypothetical protein